MVIMLVLGGGGFGGGHGGSAMAHPLKEAMQRVAEGAYVHSRETFFAVGQAG